jgi:nucleoid-associated protein YgaU
VEDDLRVAKENRSSPDLTHYRIVKAGDNLPLMTQRIYGDPKYYLEVARVNKLVNFRNLKPGQAIYFPPIEKQGSA